MEEPLPVATGVKFGGQREPTTMPSAKATPKTALARQAGRGGFTHGAQTERSPRPGKEEKRGPKTERRSPAGAQWRRGRGEKGRIRAPTRVVAHRIRPAIAGDGKGGSLQLQPKKMERRGGERIIHFSVDGHAGCGSINRVLLVGRFGAGFRFRPERRFP